MVFFNVKVYSHTGSSFQLAKLYLASGIIEFEKDVKGETVFSSIDQECKGGKTIVQAEEVKEEEPKGPEVKTPSVEQSKPEKKVKKKDNK